MPIHRRAVPFVQIFNLPKHASALSCGLKLARGMKRAFAPLSSPLMLTGETRALAQFAPRKYHLVNTTRDVAAAPAAQPEHL